MKKITLLGVLLLSAIAQAQITQVGDIAFVGFNADGDDDIAFVTFKDIVPNTTLYFCDSEWNGSGFGTDEGDFTWNSGATQIPAGTVISINSLSAAISASHGAITLNNAGGISSSSDAMFAFLGTAPRTATTLLAAISNSASGFGTLDNSGLTLGTTAILLPEGVDIAVYNGPTSGLDINGFLAQLGSAAQWLIEDTDLDDHNNGSSPDLPFNFPLFTISDSDATAPSVATVQVVDAQTVRVVFSEAVIETQAENSINFSFSPAISIASATYDDATNSVLIAHSGLTTGTAYTISIADIDDLSANTMADFTSDDLFFNNLESGLIITEIMYNAPSDDSNALEFLEIYNNTENPIALGGIQVKDESNFTFIFPEMELASNETVLLATDKTTADAFYGVSFLDMPQGISNALGNGGELIRILNTEQTVISNVSYDDASPWVTTPDGTGPSLELLNPAGNLNDATNWAAATNLIGQAGGINVYASPGSFSPVLVSLVGFDTESTFVLENAGSVTINLALSNPVTAEASVEVSVNTAGSAVEGSDFTFATQTVVLPANSTTPVAVSIPILDNSSADADRFFVLDISSTNGAQLGTIARKTVYITDNETHSPAATAALEIDYVSSYLVDANGSAEIVVHDPASQRLFVVNSTADKLAILDFSNPSAITQVAMLDMSTYGIGVTSVAYANGIVCCSVEGADFNNGKLVFMDNNGTNQVAVEAGVLPDMVTFTPDGTKLLSANEGQPNSDYSIDPEGSITVVDVSGGLASISQASATQINFNAFDNQESVLTAAGVRVFGPGANLSQDLEPEYITVSADGQTAWVTLQENNAVGTIDLTTNTITAIIPFAKKDFSQEGITFDSSDQSGQIFMANWPVFGLAMPDAMANYTVNGTTYLVTANEGDAREYDNMEEEMKVGDADYVLDPIVFPNADILKKNFNLGRLAVTSASGDTDGDGDYDEIHMFGTRSFSIWNAQTGALVYDSGDDFEHITSADPVYGALFNASNDNANFKNRSDNKGPEPEGITVAEIGGKTYAFVTMERIGGIMVYDITNPMAAEFVAYKNNRDLSGGGDLGPEGIIYIKPADSPTQKGLVVLANEVSATVSVYEITNDLLSTDSFEDKSGLTVYPNPVKDVLFFSEPSDVKLYDMSGRLVAEAMHVSQLNVSGFQSGVYMVRTKNQTHKVFIK